MLLKVFLFGMLLLGASATVSAQTQPAPNLQLRDMQGRVVRLNSFKGKVVLLNFWATWCPPCRAEIPELVKWQEMYRRRGLRVIGITYPPTKRSEVRRFVRQLRINYPILAGTKTTRAFFYKGETLPITVVIDRSGNIRAVVEGILLPEEFEEQIKPLLE